MSDVSVNSVQPSQVGPELVAYYLMTSIVSGSEYGKGYAANGAGIPIVHGVSKEVILKTYAECLLAVRRPDKV